MTVRFSLVGAPGHIAGDGRGLTDIERTRLLARLESVLLRDTDPGVRSRAATVLGQCGAASILPVLWQRVIATEDGRVQEKAWAALVEIIVRSASRDLLLEWDLRLTEAKQGPRRLQSIGRGARRLAEKGRDKGPGRIHGDVPGPGTTGAREMGSCVPLLRDLLARPGTEIEVEQRLRLLLAAGEQGAERGQSARGTSDGARRPALPGSESRSGARFREARQGSAKIAVAEPSGFAFTLDRDDVELPGPGFSGGHSAGEDLRAVAVPARRRVDPQFARRVAALVESLRSRPRAVGAAQDGVVVLPLVAVAVDEPFAVRRQGDVAAGVGEDLRRAERADDLLPLDVEEDLLLAAAGRSGVWPDSHSGCPPMCMASGRRSVPSAFIVNGTSSRLSRSSKSPRTKKKMRLVVAAPERVVDEQLLLVHVRMRRPAARRPVAGTRRAAASPSSRRSP